MLMVVSFLPIGLFAPASLIFTFKFLLESQREPLRGRGGGGGWYK